MTKMLCLLLIGLVFEAVGVVCLSRGLKQIGEVQHISAVEIIRIVQRGAMNPNILLGVFFETLFFVCLLVLMSKGEVSFIWPLTGLGFVLTTLAARFILREEVPLTRWGGVLLIMLGASLIIYSEKIKERKQPAPSAALTSSDTQ